ncbi:hypothetical protein [Rubrivirga marina]|uniref:Uncharacterized protein n=1 Tax=Rubrivirga marina TaxID=1196024 RepID=A0A271J0M8_9BACT|nr:hypothetical protein [Rubrivirga marina]PAP76604.1 hypothetical protein BSZ37_09200 [Rubrivirga marina]
MVLALVWLCLALIGVSLLMMIGFGLKNAGNALNQSKLGLAAFALPLIIFVIAYLVDGTATGAAVATAMFMSLSGFIALVISGARSLFT